MLLGLILPVMLLHSGTKQVRALMATGILKILHDVLSTECLTYPTLLSFHDGGGIHRWEHFERGFGLTCLLLTP